MSSIIIDKDNGEAISSISEPLKIHLCHKGLPNCRSNIHHHLYNPADESSTKSKYDYFQIGINLSGSLLSLECYNTLLAEVTFYPVRFNELFWLVSKPVLN